MMNVVLKNRVKYPRKLCQSFSMKKDNLKKDSGQACDTIGPPDPVSNLRPIIFTRPVKETYLQKRYRELREETQEWNQAFWSKHNTSFLEERKQFQELLKAQGKVTLNADDMSVFYKRFLDQNWQIHVDYNIAWYKRNIQILLLGIAAKMSAVKRKDKLL